MSDQFDTRTVQVAVADLEALRSWRAYRTSAPPVGAIDRLCAAIPPTDPPEEAIAAYWGRFLAECGPGPEHKSLDAGREVAVRCIRQLADAGFVWNRPWLTR